MAESLQQSPPTSQSGPWFSAAGLAVWSIVGSFTAYFCTYGFRRPFTAASFSGGSVLGINEKSMLVTSQVMGYMTSKFFGIRVIAETPPRWRAVGIVGLVAFAEGSLVLFGLLPNPWHVVGLFLDGLALGMVFGLILGFLEGRRTTELLTSCLCASFILADGFTKSVGTWLLEQGVSERWMPAAAGLVFFPPLLVSVWMLQRIPPPDDQDVVHRSDRQPMSRADRQALMRRHGLGLVLLVTAYFLVTIARSLRADFAPEIWRALGVVVDPAIFSRSEIVVALLVLLINSLSVLVVDNRRAFFLSLVLSFVGALLMLISLSALRSGRLGGFPFMVLIGIGLYLPYVAFHTTVFERLIALTRERGNLGFLMYLADSVGYLGYAMLMLARGAFPSGGEFLGFFETACWVIGALTCLCLAMSGFYFGSRTATVRENA